MIPKPTNDEHAAYFSDYITRASEQYTDALTGLRAQIEHTVKLFGSLNAEQQSYRYAPGKWTPRDMLLHMIDTERGMSYRAMCVARGDEQNLPPMDEDLYAARANADERTMDSLLSEYQNIRRASINLFGESIPSDRLNIIGTVNSNPASPRALAWIILGHDLNHCEVLRQRYLQS